VARDETVKAYAAKPNVTNMQYLIQAQMIYYELEVRIGDSEGLPSGFSSARAYMPDTDLPEYLQGTLVRHHLTKPGEFNLHIPPQF
jgi:hypothetical protein